jgi:adenylate kinase family enzyme
VKHVVILGRGGSGKSTLAAKLCEITRLPVIELDKIFWQPGLEAMPHAEWVKAQERLVERENWIIDGDLGHYDALEVRLRVADTIVLLDFPLVLCAWRVLRRGRERSDFWRWLIVYRRQSLPVLMEAIGRFAPNAELHLIKNPKELRRFVSELEQTVAK